MTQADALESWLGRILRFLKLYSSKACRYRRRGVSTIFATLLMICIVTIAGLVVLQSGLRFFAESSISFETSLGASKEKIQERCIIDDVWFYTPGQVKVSVVNTGLTPVKVIRVSFNETDVTLPKEVILGLDQSVVVSVSYSWLSGKVYLVGVETERGNMYGGYWKSP
ncbi:MAG: hypothetical protein QXJ75_05190 [Candidatus Bathyarchaeia archaeon]